jgi:hypothetical protein
VPRHAGVTSRTATGAELIDVRGSNLAFDPGPANGWNRRALPPLPGQATFDGISIPIITNATAEDLKVGFGSYETVWFMSPYRRDGRELSLPMVLAIVRPRSSKAGLVTANDHVGAAGEWGL